ncbi:hypothetical protein LSCM1_02671 [Leishmania martiniquensis]|uniref:Uncharacterized protein n=1 Tax=Leishmania martiniquensis TaxID=1580590 RepID=A0A836H2Z2_9TRYP|nr:hypothetical protein LSCM1_02671 [Leishmania martiniquensis]
MLTVSKKSSVQGVMKQISFRVIDTLCAQLLQEKHDGARIDKRIADGIRWGTVDKDTLPLIIQKIAVTRGEWCLALRVLQSSCLDTHRVRRDDNIWAIVDKGVPDSSTSKRAAHKALQAIYGSRLRKQSPPRIR